jgi:CRP/FNR family transcriptional regulator, cyclic AMP receptor protein
MLRHVPPFSLLADDELAALLPLVQRRSYRAGALILRGGDIADGLFASVSGRVTVLVDDGEAHEFIVSERGPRELFGETGLIDDRPSGVTVVSSERCEVLYVPKKRLVECLWRNAAAAMVVLRMALAGLTEAHRKIEELALMTVYERVSRVLLHGAKNVKDEWIVDAGTERIAAMVGASREMVSRVLKQMVEHGILRRHRRLLVVLDRAAIAENARLDVRNRPTVSGMRRAHPTDADGAVSPVLT